MFALVLLDVVLVALFEVLRQYDVTVLPDSVHARFLADGVDVGAGDPVRSRHVILQIDLVEELLIITLPCVKITQIMIELFKGAVF